MSAREEAETLAAAVELHLSEHKNSANSVSQAACTEDTVTMIEGLAEQEWEAAAARFLFLSPARDTVECDGIGSLLLDEEHAGKLFVKGVWINDLLEQGVCLCYSNCLYCLCTFFNEHSIYFQDNLVNA